MGHNKPGKGDDFLVGRIVEENLEKAQHLHDVGGHLAPTPETATIVVGTIGGQVLPTCPGHVCLSQVEGCCWILIATTSCTTTRPNGTTCCWRLLATTDCTDTRGNAACCWQILATTDCTHLGGNRSDCDES